MFSYLELEMTHVLQVQDEGLNQQLRTCIFFLRSYGPLLELGRLVFEPFTGAAGFPYILRCRDTE